MDRLSGVRHIKYCLLVLEILYEWEDVAVFDISAISKIEYAYIWGALRELEQRDLVSYRCNADKIKLYRLTEEGQKFLNEVENLEKYFDD